MEFNFKQIAIDDSKLLNYFENESNTNSINKLNKKILDFKSKNLPLPIKLSLHPCSGKTYFCNINNNYFKNILLYDFDNYPNNSIKRSKKIFEIISLKRHSCLLGCKEKDYNFNDNLIEINIIIPYKKLIENHTIRIKSQGNGWLCFNRILLSRECLIKFTIEKSIPFFISIEDALNFIINSWNNTV